MQIADLSHAGEARRAATARATELGFDESTVGRIALVATEAATNVARHARGGYLLMREMGGESAIELLAVDRGPGMVAVERAMRDGFSTGGTSGTGLGAIRRLADVFDIYSTPGKGTVLLARVRNGGAPVPESAGIEAGAISLPVGGERECGDAWAAMLLSSGVVAVVLADGLGHGAPAHVAAAAAVRVFRERGADAPANTLEAMHAALRSTRGAACAVAHIDPARARVRFAGVGNVSAAVITGDASHSLPSVNGTVGHELRRIHEFETPWSPASLLVMHSDGIATRWRLDHYPRLWGRHPAVVCAVIHRDFARGRDDATIVAVRTPAPMERRP